MFVRSPITSIISCPKSTRRDGSVALILSRTSAMTSAIGRVRAAFSLTRKSPVLSSVRKKPICVPVLREYDSTSGMLMSIRSTFIRILSVSSSDVPGGVA